MHVDNNGVEKWDGIKRGSKGFFVHTFEGVKDDHRESAVKERWLRLHCLKIEPRGWTVEMKITFIPIASLAVAGVQFTVDHHVL